MKFFDAMLSEKGLQSFITYLVEEEEWQRVKNWKAWRTLCKSMRRMKVAAKGLGSVGRTRCVRCCGWITEKRTREWEVHLSKVYGGLFPDAQLVGKLEFTKVLWKSTGNGWRIQITDFWKGSEGPSEIYCMHSASGYLYFYATIKPLLFGGNNELNLRLTSRLEEFDGLPILFVDGTKGEDPTRFWSDEFKNHIVNGWTMTVVIGLCSMKRKDSTRSCFNSWRRMRTCKVASCYCNL